LSEIIKNRNEQTLTWKQIPVPVPLSDSQKHGRGRTVSKVLYSGRKMR